MKKLIISILCVYLMATSGITAMTNKNSITVNFFDQDEDIAQSMSIPKDIALKIPYMKDMLTDFSQNIILLPINVVDPSSLTLIIKVVDQVYNHTPVLKFDSKFFNPTPNHEAYTPTDIPAQTRNIVFKNLSNIQDQAYINFMKACGYLQLDWALDNAALKWVYGDPNNDIDGKGAREAMALGLNKDIAMKWIYSYRYEPGTGLKRDLGSVFIYSIADLVALNKLPIINNNTLNLKKFIAERIPGTYQNKYEGQISNIIGMYLIQNKDQIINLILSDNQIETIPVNPFIGFKNLKLINLKNNPLSQQSKNFLNQPKENNPKLEILF